MSHDFDDDLIVPPDRRPLVYGGAPIVILVVAAFLFWPRGGDQANENALPSSSLVPAASGRAPPTAAGGLQGRRSHLLWQTSDG